MRASRPLPSSKVGRSSTSSRLALTAALATLALSTGALAQTTGSAGGVGPDAKAATAPDGGASDSHRAAKATNAKSAKKPMARRTPAATRGTTAPR